MEQSIYNQTRQKKIMKIVKWIMLGITAAIGFALVLGFAVMLLWNILMPEIFGLTTITYWQAVGLVLLVKLLFGSCGHPKSANPKDKIRDRLKQKHTEEGISKWKHYDRFWKEKGEQAFNDFVNNIENKNQ